MLLMPCNEGHYELLFLMNRKSKPKFESASKAKAQTCCKVRLKHLDFLVAALPRAAST